MPESKVERSRGQFRKGRTKTGGRKKGTPNKATKAWKEFVLEMSDDGEMQKALRRRVLERPELLLRVAEHAVGKPHQSVEQEFTGPIEFRWQDDLVGRLESGRQRLADARGNKEEG